MEVHFLHNPSYLKRICKELEFNKAHSLLLSPLYSIRGNTTFTYIQEHKIPLAGDEVLRVVRMQ